VTPADPDLDSARHRLSLLGAAATIVVMLAGCAQPAPTAVARPGPAAVGGPAGRCASLLAMFDDVVLDQFDVWPLMLERDDVADARAARAQAGAECTAGRYEFGIPLIESALREIGVVPPPWDGGQPGRE